MRNLFICAILVLARAFSTASFAQTGAPQYVQVKCTAFPTITITYQVKQDTTCCGHTIENWYWVSGEYTPAQAQQVDSDTAGPNGLYPGHVSVVATSTLKYNCHGYVFMNSACWEQSPHNWYGDQTPCYKLTSVPGIYRFVVKEHSAKPGNSSGLIYKGKLGQGPLAYHDSAVYGAHYAIWVKR